MILFLNFAPIEYLGGAERKMYDLYKELSKNENVIIYTLTTKLASIYGNLVLSESFKDRSDGGLLYKLNTRRFISLKSLIPLTSSWWEVRHDFINARIIYTKFEINELLIILFYLGPSGLRKTIASVRSPLVYNYPINIFDFFHNKLYTSIFIPYLLTRLQKIHVLTKRDKDYIISLYKNIEVTEIPIYADIQKGRSSSKKNKYFTIIYVGALNIRKGLDLILSSVNLLPENYRIEVIGDGPLAKNVIKKSKDYPNKLKYHGYMQHEKAINLIKKADVLILPSRAEGFGGVLLEALSLGIPIITSPAIKIDVPGNIELKMDNFKPEELVKKIVEHKGNIQHKIITKEVILNYFLRNYTKQKIMKEMLNLFK